MGGFIFPRCEHPLRQARDRMLANRAPIKRAGAALSPDHLLNDDVDEDEIE
jgi:hypothetical protein